MYATKRKFHTLLESLTKNNTSSTSLSSPRQKQKHASVASLPGDLEPSKKRRVDAAKANHRPHSSVLSPPSSRLKQRSSREVPSRTLPSGPIDRSSRIGNPEEERKPPNYAPWDRGQFLDRLKTFRHVDKWSTKPSKVDEVQWAKRGWTCVGVERVGCVGGCGKEVVIKLQGPESTYTYGEQERAENEDESWGSDGDIDEKLLNRYVDMIVTEHDESCLWRRRGCDDSIYRLPLTHPQTSIAGLRARYASLLTIASHLPAKVSLSEDVAPQVDHLLKHLSPDMFLGETGSSGNSDEAAGSAQIDIRAATLALFGWRSDESDPPLTGLATCDACFRRLGLWLFNPRPVTSTSGNARADSSAENGEEDNAAATSSLETSTFPIQYQDEEEACISRLDPVAEHRPYCPWVNAQSQNGGIKNHGGPPERPLSASQASNVDPPTQFPGWQIQLRVLRTTQHFLSGDEERPGTAESIMTTSTGVSTNAASSIASGDVLSDPAALRDEQDRERWAKLKRLKRVFDVKRSMVAGRKVKKSPTKTKMNSVDS